MNKKILVLGCNGMAGHMISVYLKEKGYNITGFAREASPFIKTEIGDAKDAARLTNIIVNGKYDIVVNALGILNQFAENNHGDAVYINSYIPHFIANLTKNTDSRIIHLSTDCVFSGKKGNYTEKSLPDGETFYDRSKAMGEIIDNKNLTIRCSIVGPDIKSKGIGLLNWFMQQSGPTVNGYTGAIWTGQTTLQLAKTIEAAISQNATGLVNMVNGESITKYELLLLFNKFLLKNKFRIIPITGIQCNKTLIRTNFDFDYHIPSYETMISELAEWINLHKHYYPHYYQHG